MITATFIDPQGAQQTDAVIYVRSATFSSSQYEVYSLDPSDFTTENTTTPPSNKHINCSFYYWTSQAAKDAALKPYILANSNENDMDFSFTPDETYDALTLVDKAEKYFTDVVLPTLV